MSQLGYSLNAAGELDLVGLINGEMEGPLVASGDWRSSIPFSLEGVTVNRNGAASNLGAIQENDVIYWNQSMRTLWVSSEKVMGIIQSLEPSASNPTSVQVLGRTYEIESAQAALALPVFLPGLLCAALSRTATSYCYATQRDRLACLLIYGEPAALLALLLLLPRALGLTGVWAAVPLSQLCTALAGAALLFRTRRAQHP